MHDFRLYPNSEADLEELTAKVVEWKRTQAKGRMQVTLTNGDRSFGVYWYKPGFAEKCENKIGQSRRKPYIPLNLIVLIDDDRDAVLFKLFFVEFMTSPYQTVILPKIANPSPVNVADVLMAQDMTTPVPGEFSMKVRYQ